MALGSVLFAAGRGRRLRPLSDLLPKPAVPLLDVPLAAIALARLQQACPPVLVNLSHLSELAIRALEPLGSDVELLIEEPQPFGSAGTLAQVRERVGPRVLVHNGDLLTDLRPEELLAAHARNGAPATVAVALVDSDADLEIDLGPSASEGRATRFLDRRFPDRRLQDRRLPDRRLQPAASGARHLARYLGMAVFERTALELLPDQRRVDQPVGLGEGLLAPLVWRGEVAVLVHRSYAVDVGTPARYLAASLDALNGSVEPPSGGWPGRIVEVEAGQATAGQATVHGMVGEPQPGLAYLGPGARCSTESLGAGAIVLARAEVDPGARITAAIVWPGKRVPSGAHLNRCIWAGGEKVLVSLPGKA